jgi:hypothetical protein
MHSANAMKLTPSVTLNSAYCAFKAKTSMNHAQHVSGMKKVFFMKSFFYSHKNVGFTATQLHTLCIISL